jgi:hypothetical protein
VRGKQHRATCEGVERIALLLPTVDLRRECRLLAGVAVVALAGTDGEEDAPDERQYAGLRGRWDGVDDAPAGGDAADEAEL